MSESDKNSDLPAKSGGVELSRSREVLESYIFATSKRDFSIYSERLLMRLVAIAQKQLAGADLRGGTSIGQVSIGPLGDAVVEIPIRSLLSEGNTNYNQAKAAIMELMHNPCQVERPKMRGGQLVYDKNGNLELEFYAYQILNSCQVNVKPGVAVLEVNRETWLSILSLGRGWRRYDLLAALRLKRVTSLRLYRLVSNQSRPMTYSVDALRTMWNMEDKYPDNYDFIKRTIEPAKAELDEKSPWSFDYVKNYSETAEVNLGRRGRKTVTSITFFPMRRLAQMSSTGLLNTIDSPEFVLGSELYRLLVNKFGFSRQGVKNNLLTFSAAKRVGMDVVAFLYDIASSALRAVNPPGYVIKAIDTRLSERYGIVKDENGYHS